DDLIEIAAAEHAVDEGVGSEERAQRGDIGPVEGVDIGQHKLLVGLFGHRSRGRIGGCLDAGRLAAAGCAFMSGSGAHRFNCFGDRARGSARERRVARMKAQFEMLAAYNAWVNERLYAAA